MGGYRVLIFLLLLSKHLEGSASFLLRRLSRRLGNECQNLDQEVLLLGERMTHLHVTSPQRLNAGQLKGQLRYKRLEHEEPPVWDFYGPSIAHDSPKIFCLDSPVNTRHGSNTLSRNKGREYPSKKAIVSNEQSEHCVRGRKYPKEPLLSIVSFNTNWLYVPSVRRNQHLDKLCPWKSPQQALRHMEVIAEQINRINAQIFVLSEVHDLCTLEALRQHLDGSQEYSAYLVPGTDEYLNMNVGILTRLAPEAPLERLSCMAPLVMNGDYRTNPKVGVSKSIVAKFLVKHKDHQTGISTEYRVAVIGAHLRSGTRHKGAIRARQAQANIISEFVDGYTREGYRVVVAGDLNDFDRKVRGKRDHSTESQVLETIKNSGNRLLNPFGRIPLSRRFSTWRETFVDHILVDSTLSVDSCEIYNHHHSLEYFYGGGTPEEHFYSDHYPVRVDISYR